MFVPHPTSCKAMSWVVLCFSAILPCAAWWFFGFPGEIKGDRPGESHPQEMVIEVRPDKPLFEDTPFPMTDPYVCHINGNIYHQYTLNVGINLPYMDPMGFGDTKDAQISPISFAGQLFELCHARLGARQLMIRPRPLFLPMAPASMAHFQVLDG